MDYDVEIKNVLFERWIIYLYLTNKLKFVLSENPLLKT